MNFLKLLPLTKSTTTSVSIPGSKSYTNRALITAAMTENPITILNPLFSDDTQAMISCLQTLGININVFDDKVEVIGSVKDIQDKEYTLNANLSGTTIRFILALACLVPGVKIIHGEEGLNKRPVGELVKGLQQLGAEIEYTENEGFPPIKVTSSTLSNTITKLNGDVSSQYFSALFMIAPLLQQDVIIEVQGNQISKSYIDMTIDMLKDWDVNVVNENYQTYRIPAHQKYKMTEYIVEGDYSGAGYFFAIAALTQSTITLKNLNPNSKQGDLEFAKILEKMGNQLILGENEITIIGKGIQPIEIDMEQCPDQAQTLAVLAAFANGVTKMTGVRSLRVKETERVKATQNELHKMGIKTESPDEDTLIIYGGNPQPAAIDTYGDHRMAMAFAVAGTKMEGIKINNPEVVNKTFPNFWEKLKELGVQIT
jgi:3-phosphoshikimate 1-carboxyvinyltransferase